MDVTFGPRDTKRPRRHRHHVRAESTTESNGDGQMDVNSDAEPEPEYAHPEIPRSVHKKSQSSLPGDPDDDRLTRTNSTGEQSTDTTVSGVATYSSLHIDFAEHQDPNDRPIQFDPPMVQSRSITAHHEHPRQSSTTPSQDSSYLNMAVTQPAPMARNGPSTSLSNGDSLADLEDVDLEVLDYLASHPSNLELLAASSWPSSTMASQQIMGTRHAFPPTAPESAAGSSPDLYMTYYPDATYKDLHSQLHDHMVKAARNVALTRQGSPESFPSRLLSGSRAGGPTFSPTSSGRSGLLPNSHMSQKRQIELWQNYLDEVAPWMDMFDNNKHWHTTIAQMAQRVDYLQYSLLALSARQLERKSKAKSHTESLNLYSEAIKLIAVQLPTLCTEIIAACVLLCVLEMMSSSPRAWAKHLDGIALLLEAAGVNGVVGGVRQALFWTFARMDVWGGFLGDTATKLPTNRWSISTDSMSAAVRQFKGRAGSDSYANYAVFLCVGVVNVLSNKGLESADHSSTFVSRWKALYGLLEGWYNDRPEEMKPLMNVAPSKEDMNSSPFNTILYSTPPGINGNQLYHASMLLLLQDRPKEIRIPRSHKSMLWHARQICGIALSNRDHGALINALQPLWIAGRLMSHHSEHMAILDLLKRLEEDTGWAASWRAEDLKEYWGLYEES